MATVTRIAAPRTGPLENIDCCTWRSTESAFMFAHNA